METEEVSHLIKEMEQEKEVVSVSVQLKELPDLQKDSQVSKSPKLNLQQ